MKVTVDGSTYEFEAGKFYFKELRAIQKVTGLTMNEFFQGLDKGNVEALGALIWIMKKRAGEDVKYADLDFDMGSMEFDLGDEEAEAENTEPGDKENPTNAEESAPEKTRKKNSTSEHIE